MDGQLRSPYGGTADYEHVDGCPSNPFPSQFDIDDDDDFPYNDPQYTVFGGVSQESNYGGFVDEWGLLGSEHSVTEADYGNPRPYPADIETEGIFMAALSLTPPSQYQYPPLDPREALNDVRDTLLHRPSTPWNAVSIDPTFLAPPSDYAFPSRSATPTHTDYPYSQSAGGTSLPSRPASTIDGVSIRSDHSNTCPLCEKKVSTRMLQRHNREVHGPADDPRYVCRCGRRSPRKWNHERHLKDGCKAANDYSQGLFTCICQQTTDDKLAHQRHIKNCSKKQAGRPRNNTRSVQ